MQHSTRLTSVLIKIFIVYQHAITSLFGESDSDYELLREKKGLFDLRVWLFKDGKISKLIGNLLRINF